LHDLQAGLDATFAPFGGWEMPLAYADGTGAIHIDLPGVLLHVEPGRSTAGGSTRRPAGMGVVGVRVVQCLLGDPTREWSVADLARQAACAAGEAHRIIGTFGD